jgi:hypothetical protein
MTYTCWIVSARMEKHDGPYWSTLQIVEHASEVQSVGCTVIIPVPPHVQPAASEDGNVITPRGVCVVREEEVYFEKEANRGCMVSNCIGSCHEACFVRRRR